ncbi:hypothetical protein ABEF93_006530 [Exophiala dermatitidis]
MLMPSQRRRPKRPLPETGAGPARGPGRPMKRASELKPSRKARTEHAKRLHSEMSGSMMRSSTLSAGAQPDGAQDRLSLSHLETLPVELIQHIFFLSFEVNMARASPQLARVLSKPSIYKALLLFAYFDEPADKIPVETHHFLPAEYRQISLDEKMRLQRAILGCKWFTLDLFKSCMPILSRLQMVEEWHWEHQSEALLDMSSEGHVLVAGSSQVPGEQAEFLQSVAALPSLADQAGMERHFFATLEPAAVAASSYVVGSDPQHPNHQHPDAPAQSQTGQGSSSQVVGPIGARNTLPRIMRWTCSVDTHGRLHKTPEQGISILAARVFPNHVLRGSPWTESRLELVQLLRQGMRFLARDHVLDISATALFEGMASAIRERNETALLVLLELHYATMRFHPSHDPDWFPGTTPPVPKGPHRYWVGPLAHPLPVELFHLAVKKHTGTHVHWHSGVGDRIHDHNHNHKSDVSSSHGHGAKESTSAATTTPARLLTLLLREGIDSIPSDDKILTRWAAHTLNVPVDSAQSFSSATSSSATAPAPAPASVSQSSLSFERSLARWLLDFMSGTNTDVTHHLPPTEPLFVNGRLSSRLTEGSSLTATLFPDTSFTEEIGYLTHGLTDEEIVRARDGRPCG